MTDSVTPKVLHHSRFLDLVETEGWVFVRRPNAHAVVCILAVTPQEKIILVEQFRKPIGKRLLELPAGLVGDGDDANEALELAANRELEEESGWSAKQLKKLWEGPSSAGLTDEIITCYHALELEKLGSGGGVEGEDITVHEVPLSDLRSWLETRRNEGVGADPKIFSALWSAGIAA
ncbi:MAG: hypothetical protein RL318_2771 [Fibrobacterota bacterium]|jgi:ADP-ribose pyrophosphatase